MSFACPACAKTLDVKPAYGGGYVHSAILLHFSKCHGTDCPDQMRSVCAAAATQAVMTESEGQFACPGRAVTSL